MGPSGTPLTLTAGYIIGIDDHEPSPNTLVTFVALKVTNTGVPSGVTHWKLEVKFPGRREPLTGRPDLRGQVFRSSKDPSKIVFWWEPEELLFDRVAHPFSGTLIGIVSFDIPNVDKDIVRQLGNTLIVSCQDDKGKVYTVEETTRPDEVPVQN
jgi:hypothetical protein